MALEDYIEPEVGVAVAVTAAVTSPRVRGALRKGAVYGLAGLLMAGDAISNFARGVGRGAQQMADEAQQTAEDGQETAAEARADKNGAEAESAPPRRARKTAEEKENE